MTARTERILQALLLAASVAGLVLPLGLRESHAQTAPSAAPASAPASAAAAGVALAASAPASAAASTSANASASITAGATAASAASAPAVARAASSPSAASGAVVQVQPVRPPASQATVRLPPRLICENSASDPDRCDPLTLERNPVTLPAATVGKAYRRAVRAEGGLPPYRFDLAQGKLPAGLVLSPQGEISGTASAIGPSQFRVRVVDDLGDVASQAYSLRVVGDSPRPAKPASAPASQPVLPLTQIDVSQPAPTAHAQPTARVYQLEAAQLDALKERIKGGEAPPETTIVVDGSAPPEAAPEPAAAASAPTPPAPADLVWSDAQHTQLEALLKPVMAVEYPTRALFEAAVDAQVCAQAWQLIVNEAQRLKQLPPKQQDFDKICTAAPAPRTTKAAPRAASTATRAAADASATASGPAAAPASPPASSPSTAPAAAPSPVTPTATTTAPAAPSTASAAAPAGQPVSWRDLPAWLMPLGLRSWLADAAVRERPLSTTKTPTWTPAAGCQCNPPRTKEPLYAVYPSWLAADPPKQTVDFSLINRLSYLALPLGNEQALNPTQWTEAQTAFIRTARTFETRVDFGVYRSDWRFLATEPTSQRDAEIERLTVDNTRMTREMLDTPLPGLVSRAKSWLPGFGEVQRLGDGVTVFFDQAPDPQKEPQLAARFTDFYPRYVQGLTQAMLQNPDRVYAINLVMTDKQMFDEQGPFTPAKLFALLKAVENPKVVEGRIVETSSDYVRGNNIELRFLVLLSEPTTRTAERLRALIGGTPSLNESDRRIVLRSTVPLLLLPQDSMQNYLDDLVYVQDNFGGIGFWPTPVTEPQFNAQQALALRTTFGPDQSNRVSQAVCGVVCPNRWLVRLAFELLVLAGLVCWAVLQWRCDLRERYGRYAALVAVPPVIVGAALAQCDPALEWMRSSGITLIALIALPLVGAIWVLLKRREDKP
ncbi:Ig domain-containing protein [Ideonella sp. DXS29W]|uniref:Ig domain-containing protein n=1 Tax=Ideonella lacteola TaxID=2984193 RepID=A0ABU9BWY8_9BURK